MKAFRNSSLVEQIQDQISDCSSLVLSEYSASDVQNMAHAELLHLQNLLGHGSQFGVWSTPRSWFPGGSEAAWKACFSDRILGHLDSFMKESAELSLDKNFRESKIFDHTVLSCTRYLILCRIGPISLKNWRDSLDPSVVAQLAYSHLPILAAWSIWKRLALLTSHSNRQDEAYKDDLERGCFKHLSVADVDLVPFAVSVKNSMRSELARMHGASVRGLWGDFPQVTSEVVHITKVSGLRGELISETARSPHLPLPDEYVASMGQKSHWLILNIAPNLLQILKEFQAIWRTAATSNMNSRDVSEKCKYYLEQFVWRDSNDSIISALPFELSLSQRGRHSKKSAVKNSKLKSLESDSKADWVQIKARNPHSWPPTGAAQIFGLTRLLQGAHLFVVGLSTGARNAETLMMERSCVHRAPNGITYANGRTYKLVRQHDGEKRDWALPDLAVKAIAQQVELISLVESLCPLSLSGSIESPDLVVPGKGLWFASENRRKTATSAIFQAILKEYAAALGMELAPGGQLIRPHRLRKTLARMVALAIDHAPKILQDVFGHKSIEMTLYYVLTDPTLSAEIDTIVKELKIMRCIEVITPIVEQGITPFNENLGLGDDGTGAGFGGGAARPIKDAVTRFGEGLHQSSKDWNAESISDLAQILTLGGTSWNLVRPGVICTKSLGESGPCNKKRGHPDPGNCQSRCDYRLEESWQRADADSCIGESIENWGRESSAGNDLIAEFWAGQVRMHLERFPDLRERWLQDERVIGLTQYNPALGTTP